jgi:peptide/nickel transport system permease protein
MASLRNYIVRRIVETIPVIFIVVIINFSLIHLAPSDPAVILAGEYADPGYIEAIRIKYGLNLPLHEQLINYLNHLLRGDLGFSIQYNRSVASLIRERLPLTLLIIVPGEILGIILGTLLGAYAARKHGSKIDAILSTTSFALYSTPSFWIGLMFIILFGVVLRIFPIGGYRTIFENLTGIEYVLDVLWHMFLPMFTIMISWCLPISLRIARASVMETMREDYIVTARAKGLKESVVFYKHALRNALLPTITMTGMWLAFSITGSILIETIFGWPGMGNLTRESIFARDYPILMAVLLMASITVVLASMISDILYAYLDPRVVYK